MAETPSEKWCTDCGVNPPHCRGYCLSCYGLRVRSHTLPPRVCIYPGCEETAHGKGNRCEEHRTKCIVSSCDNSVVSGRRESYCYKHSYANQKYGDPEHELRNMSPKRNRVITRGGYVHIRVDGKYKFEHRLVMEKIIGRPLLPEENVHHINGDKEDNRPENLELWSTSQPSGQRVKDKLEWARKIIELYGRQAL